MNAIQPVKSTFAALLLLVVINCYSQKDDPDHSLVVGVFAASTPCSQGTRPLPGIPVNADCELIKWNLTLFRNESKETPTTYKLHCTYGLSKPGTTGFIGGGTTIEMEGKCAFTKGTAANPNAVVYALKDDKTNKIISFLKLDGNLLHLLDSDRNLMIGSSAWSYTLSRIGNR